MANKLWIKWDYDFLDDPKLIRLRMKYGLTGIGIYMALLHLLVNNEGRYELDLDIISFTYNESKESIESVIKDFDLFIIEDNHFYSLRLLNHIEKLKRAYADISAVKAVSGRKGGLTKAMNRKTKLNDFSSLDNFFENPPQGD